MRPCSKLVGDDVRHLLARSSSAVSAVGPGSSWPMVALRRRKKSRPFLPTISSVISRAGGVARFCSSVKRCTARNDVGVEAAARPRSEVSGDQRQPLGRAPVAAAGARRRRRAARPRRSPRPARWRRARAPTMASWARRRRAADTSFMARVIFCVDLTDAIRVRMALREGIGRLRVRPPARRARTRLPNSPSTAFMRGGQVVPGLLVGALGRDLAPAAPAWRASTNAYSSRS